MSIKTLPPQHSLIFALFGVSVLINTAWADTTGGIATDGTLGAALVLNGANVTIAQSLGTTAGNNLFHSFADFNINTGQSVTFTGADNLQNVFSRVTGSDVTKIEGTLKSTIANAAFFFINPNGITFGADAQVDVPGAFHVSSANKIDFPNNGTFYADRNQASTLSSDAPAAFGFLQTTAANNGLIKVNGAQLAVKAGQTLDVVAGEIALKNDTTVVAPAGEIRLVATQSDGSISLEHATNDMLPLPKAIPSTNNAGRLTINAGTISAAGNGGGRIALWGGNTTFANSAVWADNVGIKNAASAQNITIHSYSLSVDNSWVTFNTWDTGNAGNISVQTAILDILNGSQISTATFNQGDTGTLSVATDTLTIDSLGNSSAPTGIFSEAFMGSGHAGNLTIQAGTLNILNGGQILSSNNAQLNPGSITVKAGTLSIDSRGNSSLLTGIISEAYKGTGQASNITVDTEKLDILNGGGIASFTHAQANAGNITVNADTLNIDNVNDTSILTGIFSEATPDTTGHAGNVAIKAGTLDVVNGGRVSSSTYGQGDAGGVAVTADMLTINSLDNASVLTGIFSEATPGSTGHAGSLAIKAGTLDLIRGGRISSSTYTQGNAGSITVDADTLTIDNLDYPSISPGIFSDTYLGSGQAGDVTVRAGKLDLINKGKISSTSYHQGNAGNIAVTADTVNIDAQGDTSWNTGIISAAWNKGQAGHVDIQAGALSLNNLANISSDTYDMGSAGTIGINAETVDVFGGSYISSTSWGSDSSGKTGGITITASNRLRLAENGQISVENQSNVSVTDAISIHPGSITITAADIDMKDYGSIVSRSTGNVAAGNVGINFSHWLTMDSSVVSTTANIGDGGSIVINGGELISLQNSVFRTSVSGANSNGGNIFSKTDTLVMDSGLIQANAVSGSGGDISLNLKTLIPSGNSLLLGGSPVIWQPSEFGFNLIQAASQTGVSGTVNVTAPQLNLSGIIANLGNPQFDTDIISQDYCGLGTDSSLTRTGVGGLKPKSSNQLLF